MKQEHQPAAYVKSREQPAFSTNDTADAFPKYLLRTRTSLNGLGPVLSRLKTALPRVIWAHAAVSGTRQQNARRAAPPTRLAATGNNTPAAADSDGCRPHAACRSAKRPAPANA